METMRTYIHARNRKYVAAKDISVFFKISVSFLICVRQFIVQFYTLICTTVFEKSSSAEWNMEI